MPRKTKMLMQGTLLNQQVLSGNTLSIENGGILDVETGGELRIAGVAVTPVASELNVLNGIPSAQSTLTPGAEAANVIKVTIQLKDAASADLAVRGSILAYLSDDVNGDSIVAAAPDGGWAIATDGLLIPIVAGKCAQLVSESDGDIDVNITHAAGAKTCYMVLVLPNGLLKASGAITFA